MKKFGLFYTSLFFGHAEAEMVATVMHSKMLEYGLPVDRIATLVGDGPSVNKAIFQKMNELILQDYSEFLGLSDLGSYTIHTVHNVFGKGMEQFGKEIIQLFIDLHSLFKYSAARWEDFKELQMEMDLEVHNFHQLTEICWLHTGPSIKRIHKQWEEICCFVVELAKDSKKVQKSINYKRVYMLLGTKEKAVTKATLEFLNNLIPLFEQFVPIFQKSSLVVHVVYNSMCDILAKPMRKHKCLGRSMDQIWQVLNVRT